MKYLDELKALNLPNGEFSICGSGPLAIRRIRECRDIDVIVTKKLWETLSKSHPVTAGKLISIGHIEIFRGWPYIDDIEKAIEDSDIIDNIRFVKLSDTLRWKKVMDREKDRNDIMLIENYEKNKN